MNDVDGLKVGLDELNRDLKLQYEGVDTLKATARSILSAASLVAGLMGVLQLARPAIQPEFISLYNFGIVSAVGLYVALIVVTVKSITAVSMLAPMAAKWETIRDYFENKTGVDLVKMQIGALLNAIAANEPIVDRQRQLVLTACVLLPMIVVVLFLLSLIPRVI